MFRSLSVFLRKRKAAKSLEKEMASFHQVKAEIEKFQAVAHPVSGRVALVRTDDIGDYLVFRNYLEIYSNLILRTSFILIGNKAWKSIFEKYDATLFDQVVWIDKPKFKTDAVYRNELLRQIQSLGIETIIVPERTRRLLVNDVLVLASQAPIRIGAKNTNDGEAINLLSDSFYTSLYADSYAMEHESIYNQHFINWLTEKNVGIQKPSFSIEQKPRNSIICAIGSSQPSKRWPASHWTDLLLKIKIQLGTLENVLLVGGPGDLENANLILEKVNCTSLVGKNSLLETIELLQSAYLSISNDSFALHAAVSSEVPHIFVLANGNNSFRFCDYKSIADQVIPIYATYYQKHKEHMSDQKKWFLTSPSSDMSSISVSTVWSVIEKYL